MKVIFLDMDDVLQLYDFHNRFEHDRKALVSELSQKFHRNYSIYDEYDVAACDLDCDKDIRK